MRQYGGTGLLRSSRHFEAEIFLFFSLSFFILLQWPIETWRVKALFWNSLGAPGLNWKYKLQIRDAYGSWICREKERERKRESTVTFGAWSPYRLALWLRIFTFTYFLFSISLLLSRWSRYLVRWVVLREKSAIFPSSDMVEVSGNIFWRKLRKIRRGEIRIIVGRYADLLSTINITSWGSGS